VAATDVHYSAYSHYPGPFNPDDLARCAPAFFDTAVRSRRHSGRTPVKSEQPRPWSRLGGQAGHSGKHFMSERATDQQDPSGTSTNGHERSGRLSAAASLSHQHEHRPTSVPSTAPSPSLPRQEATHRPYELPPLPQPLNPAGSGFSPSASRLAGVFSILNPLSSDDTAQSRRRKASELESPPPASLPSLAFASQAATSSRHSAASPVPSMGGFSERGPRRILTPRSPSLHRAASLGQLNSSAATVSAQYTPFLSSPRPRSYAVEPGVSGVPPMPTLSVATRPKYGSQSGPSPPSETKRRASSSARGPGVVSASVSPTTSYSSYSQTGQTSPAVQYGPVSVGSGPYSASLGITGLPLTSAGMSMTASGAERRPMGIPISSSGGQNVYQMMTLETTSGTVQLPVDVQAASRVADEKRRRNAGASARFRQRRKEKEREASVTIGRLEQQVKELGEDAEFYKRERDYLAGVLLSIPHGERHFPRPASPRRHRSSATQAVPTGGAVPSYGSVVEPSHSPDQGRNVRRRTSTLSISQQQQQQQQQQQHQQQPQQQPLPPPPISLSSHAGKFQHHMHAFGNPNAPQQTPGIHQPVGVEPAPLMRMPIPPPTALPPVQPPSGADPPPQLMQAPPQTGPWNPFAPERRPPASQGRPDAAREARGA